LTDNNDIPDPKFDARWSELIQKGYVEIVGADKEGRAQFRLTSKSSEYFSCNL